MILPVAVILLAALAGCSGDPEGGTGGAGASSMASTTSSAGGGAGSGGAGSGGEDAGTPPTELLAVVDLPRTSATRGLSGTWYDAATRTLYAIQDLAPRVVPIAVGEDLLTFTPGAPIDLTGRPGSAWDGEGIVMAGGVFTAVTVETTPLVERFDATGHYLGPVDVPPIFAKQASNNKGLESLALSPSGAFLFTANESALTVDGAPPSKTKGTTVRILRRELGTGNDEQHAYRTDPLGEGTGGDMGVSDVLALGDSDLLILERGFQSDFGNTVRIYRVDFASPGADDVSAVPSLSASTPVLDKTLVVDVGSLPTLGATHPGIEPNPILDNFEALALGPALDDGRRVVFVTSDDNASVDQVPRVLVIAVNGL